MEVITLKEVLEAVEGKLVIKGETEEYNSVSTDTRKIQKGDIFIALKGENFNGNKFTINAIESGASLCIVDEICFKSEDVLNKSYIVKVKDTGKALLDLARYYKNKLNIKVIAITGSTGKTSTKDLVAATLSNNFKVFKTEGNFNNEIGLPLMVFKLDKSYDIAVLEMGMNHFGEIHRMAEVANPDIAIITNIGISHIENLGSRENILKAKLEITDFFGKDNLLILNGDNDILSTYKNNDYKLYNISTIDKSNSSFFAENINLSEKDGSFDIFEQGENKYKDFKIPVPGKHNVLNSLLAIACGKYFGMSYDEMQNGMKNLKSTSMRLDIIKKESFTIINDCYNASPDSMKAAIDVMKNVDGKRKILVLGDMLELGKESFNAHKSIGEYARKNGVEVIIAIGKFSNAYKEGFISSEDKKYFKQCETREEAFKYIENILQKRDIILVKASRSMRLEKIVDKLKNINS
ncbi:UDP-N-acetylmuramoyl-tripeptide--D-alanyl-D-alanine ligase [Clostridium oceanicum]|uniref:UDP-N-acetylmuramoyl-tripeptide--D-alanyl-D-alanine ligase n=1 Tax=Clostridium oceanicum TaxID=1543 RepID=A0ABP3V050_9CLOT